MSWSEKPVLVTGAGGFIGSHLVGRLASLGAKVRAFIRYTSRNDWGLLEYLPDAIRKKIEVVSGDLLNPESLFEAMDGVEVVFHLGSLIAIPYSYVHPREAATTNMIGTYNVMNAARDRKVGRVVHTSSSEVYGTARYVPIDEEHPLQAQSPYAASKIGADKIAESFFRSYELPVVTVRPFNTYGPRQSARAVIPTIITQALSASEVLMGATHPTRDLTYVDDTIEGFIRLAEAADVEGQVFNLGVGKEISIGDLADKIIELVGRPCRVIFDAIRIRPTSSEVDRLCSNNAKVRSQVGWEPRVSLDEGLRKTIEWYAEHLDDFKPEIYNI